MTKATVPSNILTSSKPQNTVLSHQPIVQHAEEISDTYTIHTRCLFDSLLSSFLSNVSLTVSHKTGLISCVHHRPSLAPSSCLYPATPEDLDLTDFPLVLPGLVDLHTHIFLHDYTSAISSVQETQESPVERIVRATNHLRAALKAGFTTYRDLGTEGLFTADIDVRNAVNRGIIPGPRLFVAGEAIASSAGYAVRSENDISASIGSPYGGPGAGYALGTTNLGRISDQADGAVGVRAAVRRRLGTGADLVKVYADYRSRALRWPAANLVYRPDDANRELQFPPTGPFARNPAIPLWTWEELATLVLQANAMGSTVAAHAITARAATMAIRAGVTSIEHAWEDESNESVWNPFSTPLPPDSTLKLMAHRQTIWNPTLYILETELPPPQLKATYARVQRAYELGVPIGVGGDTGGVPHGGNAREIELLVNECHLPLEYVLRAATLGGWEGIWGRKVLCTDGKITLGSVIGQADTCDVKSNEWSGEQVRRFGALREGWVADLVAFGKDVREDLGALRDVRVVVKDGKVVVRDGGVVE